MPRAARRAPRLLVPILLTIAYAGQCAWFIATQSLTFDEPAHIIAGLDAWQHRRFERWNDQPPLARLLLTAPLLPDSERWRIESGGRIEPNPYELAWHTRPVNVALGIILAWLLWTTARRMFSDGGANLALALFVFSPPLIAHFSMATVDGAMALFLFATAAVLVRWRSRPSWPATFLLGAVLGGLLTSKFSAPPMALLAVALMLVPSREPIRIGQRALKAATAATVALIVVWAIYFFQFAPITLQSGRLDALDAGPHGAIVPIAAPLHATVRLPASSYLAGFSNVAQHAVRGQQTFLLGEVRKAGGWRSYYPIVAALKWPVLTLLLAAATVALALRGTIRWPNELSIVMAFPIVFFALAMMSNLDIGDRYILPVYPFVILVCAGLWSALRWRERAIPIVLVLGALQAADCVRYAPDYLSYFNVFVRPDRSYELLTDSNLDWGQGLIALRDYQGAHPDEPIRLMYFGDVDPSQYGIRAQPLAEHERATGTIVVSATHLSGQYLEDPNAYKWLLRHPRVAILNHTLHVFRVP